MKRSASRRMSYSLSLPNYFGPYGLIGPILSQYYKQSRRTGQQLQGGVGLKGQRGIINMQGEEERSFNKIESISNYKELFYQERERRRELQQLLEIERIKVKKLTANPGKSKTRYCSLCSANLASRKDLEKEDSTLISQFKDFSEKMSVLRFDSQRDNLEPSLMSGLQDDPTRRRHVGMIENFSVFGTKEGTISEYMLDSKMGNEFEGEILYSKKEKNDIEMQASKLVFPSGMAIKKYGSNKAKEKTIELMSYCYTNLKSFILNFECPDSSFEDHFNNNELLNHINPDHRLFCICIGIHDYTWLDTNRNKLNISLGNIEHSSNSLELHEESKIKSEGCEGALSNKESFKSIEEGLENINDLEIGITQRVFCIMTYYPFFSFFEEILRNLINIVKMERLAIYKHNEENIKLTIRQTDSRFQMERMIELFDLCYRDLEFKKISFNKEYELRLINQQKITMMTYWDDAKVFFIREWVYSILSMFNLDTFLDLFTLIMLEDRIVFICENSHILTHTIYLFTHVLTKPLKYPFPVVNIIPSQDEDFLNAPFPVVYGMLKKRKSLEDRKILENYDNTYVFLSPDKVDIFYQQDRKAILNNRSVKLSNNKELKQTFKELKKNRKKQQKSSKYEIESSEYCILSNSQQKQRAVKIVSIVNQFMSEEIVKKLPSQVELENMKKKIDFKNLPEQKDEHSHMMNLISADIKKAAKDPFVTNFLSTQMINNYMFK